MRKVAKDKKSVSDVNHIVKKSNTKLSELQAELQELDSQLLVTQGNLSNSPLTGGNIQNATDPGPQLNQCFGSGSFCLDRTFFLRPDQDP